MKFLFIPLIMLFLSGPVPAQPVKETDYSRWLDDLVSTIQTTLAFNDYQKSMGEFYYRLDQMPVSLDTSDTRIFFNKLQTVVKEFIQFDISEQEVFLYRLLVEEVSPVNQVYTDVSIDRLFLAHYQFLLEHYRSFEYSKNEQRLLIYSIATLPRNFRLMEAYQKQIQFYLMERQYDAFRSHLLFLIEEQVNDRTDQNPYKSVVRIPVNEIERLRELTLQRKTEGMLRMIDEWIIRSRHGRR